MQIPGKTQIIIKINRLKNDLKALFDELTKGVKNEDLKKVLPHNVTKDICSILGFLQKNPDKHIYEYLISWAAIVEAHTYSHPDSDLNIDTIDMISNWEDLQESAQEKILNMVKQQMEELTYCFTLNLLKLGKNIGEFSDEVYEHKFELAKKFLLDYIVFLIRLDNKTDDIEKEKLAEYQKMMEHHPVEIDEEEDVAETTKKSLSETVVEQKKRSLEAVLQELEELVGMEAVKAEVKKLLNFVKVNKMREEKGMSKMEISLHTVFSGPPGTGKTSVARLLAEAFREIGILKKGHLVETDRSSLVAGYVGQTAIKTKEVIQSALDGLLFIDEAYMLNSGDDDYGQEAIDTLLKMMEDNRSRLVVIAAGYENEMNKFIDSNPGLRSRFNKSIFFADYSQDELMQIFDRMVAKNKFKITKEAKALVLENIQTSSANENFGNARYVRNLFEKIIQNQFSRIAELDNATEEEMNTITKEDIVSI